MEQKDATGRNDPTVPEKLRLLRIGLQGAAPAVQRALLERPKTITGRDELIVREALAYAIVAIGALPNRWRQDGKRREMVRLLRRFAMPKKFESNLINARRHLSQNGAVALATTPLDEPAEETAADKPKDEEK